MKRNVYPMLAVGAVILVAIPCLSGCVTSMALEQAKGRTTTWKNDRGEECKFVVPPEPGYYALLPLTVVADVALVPAYLLGTVFSLTVYGRLPY